MKSNYLFIILSVFSEVSLLSFDWKPSYKKNKNEGIQELIESGLSCSEFDGHYCTSRVAFNCVKNYTRECSRLNDFIILARKHKIKVANINRLEKDIINNSKNRSFRSLNRLDKETILALPCEGIALFKERLQEAQQEYPDYTKTFKQLLSKDEQKELDTIIKILTKDIPNRELEEELRIIYNVL
jgi:hypothetical protein